MCANVLKRKEWNFSIEAFVFKKIENLKIYQVLENFEQSAPIKLRQSQLQTIVWIA